MTDLERLAGWLRAIGDAEPHTEACITTSAFGDSVLPCTCDQVERASLAQAAIVLLSIREGVRKMRTYENAQVELPEAVVFALAVIERAAKEGPHA